MMPHKRGPWSQTEDNYLLTLVHQQGAYNWVRISQMIGSRSPKQCRERFHQNLKPTLNHDPITPEEGAVIERLVGEMGKRWAEIARRLRGRSDNAVKNWWNGGMNRRRRIVVKREGSSRYPPDFDENSESLSYARPVHPLARPVTDIMIPPSRRRIDAPLISPATSDVSMADSFGDAPSLVSDSSSMISTSPNVTKMAHLHLPPPTTPKSDAYRPQLPNLPYDGRKIASDKQPHVSPHGETSLAPLGHHHPRLHQFAEVATHAEMSRPQLNCIPHQQYQLPPFSSFISTVAPSESAPAKTRMSVSSLVD
ncbi:MAG: hypothetical protein Q9190_004677 [Brigantiaea leucoxantha]